MKNKAIVFFTYLLILHVVLGLLFKFLSPFLMMALSGVITDINIIYSILWLVFAIILFFLGKYYYNRSVDKGYISQENPINDIILSIVAFSIVPVGLFFLFTPMESEEPSNYHFVFLVYIVVFAIFQFIFSKPKK